MGVFCKDKTYVYIAQIEQYKTNDIMPLYAQKEINNANNEVIKNQKKATYGLLHRAVNEIFNINDDFSHLKKTKEGKPISKNFYLSISHSKDLVAVALSSENIGIDLQVINLDVDTNRLAQRILSIEEQKNDNYNKEEVIKLWTQKEAKIKYDGIKTYNTKQININSLKVKNYKFTKGQENYILSVVGDKLKEVEIINLI